MAAAFAARPQVTASAPRYRCSGKQLAVATIAGNRVVRACAIADSLTAGSVPQCANCRDRRITPANGKGLKRPPGSQTLWRHRSDSGPIGMRSSFDSFTCPAIGSHAAGRETRSRFGSRLRAGALVGNAHPGGAGLTLRLKFGEFLIFLRRHCDEIRNSGNRTGVQPMACRLATSKQPEASGCQPHGGRTSAMPTA